MADGNYIPVGRTSMTKQGDTPLQVQTEYASRPAPRITTTISHQGRVIHKIERNLHKTIESPEEQGRVERTLRSQHSEIIGIIQKRRFPGSSPANQRPETTIETGNEIPVDPSASVSNAVAAADYDLSSASAYEKLQAIPGVKRIYRLDNEGNFVGQDEPTRFKQAFAALFRNLQELMEVFALTPGVGITREKGVYEVEADHIYFASAGYECFFVVVTRIDDSTDYEKSIKSAIAGL
jgi:hypothetical protein